MDHDKPTQPSILSVLQAQDIEKGMLVPSIFPAVRRTRKPSSSLSTFIKKTTDDLAESLDLRITEEQVLDFKIDPQALSARWTAKERADMDEFNARMQAHANAMGQRLFQQRQQQVALMHEQLAVMIGMTLTDDETQSVRLGWEAMSRQWMPMTKAEADRFVKQSETMLVTNYYFRTVRDAMRRRWNVALVMLGLPELDFNQPTEIRTLGDDSIYAKIIDFPRDK